MFTLPSFCVRACGLAHVWDTKVISAGIVGAYRDGAAWGTGPHTLAVRASSASATLCGDTEYPAWSGLTFSGRLGWPPLGVRPFVAWQVACDAQKARYPRSLVRWCACLFTRFPMVRRCVEPRGVFVIFHLQRSSHGHMYRVGSTALNPGLTGSRTSSPLGGKPACCHTRVLEQLPLAAGGPCLGGLTSLSLGPLLLHIPGALPIQTYR